MSYKLEPGYDYTQHWSRRDREDPRLAGKTHQESLQSFYRQFAQDLATNTYKYFNDEARMTKEFEEKLERELYYMARENLYGFGKYVLNGTLWPITNNLYNNIVEQYHKSLIHWWSLSIQCDTNTNVYKDEAAWREGCAEFIANLESFGITVDYAEHRQNEIERVEAYCASETAMIRAAGGWRGD